MTEREELEQLAAQERERVLAGLPPEPDSVRRRGVLHGLLYEYDLALAAYDEAEGLLREQGKPADPRISINRGAVLRELGRFSDALAEQDKAEALYRAQGQEPHPAVAVNRGTAYRSLGLLEQSLEQYDLALRQGGEQGIAPHYIIYLNRGSVLFYLGRIEEALASYAIADRIQAEQGLPRDPMLVLSYGMVSEYRQQFDEALAQYDEAERMTAERGMQPHPNIAVNRANVLLKLGRREEALAAYTESLWRYGRLGAQVPEFVRQKIECVMKNGPECPLGSPDAPVGERPGRAKDAACEALGGQAAAAGQPAVAGQAEPAAETVQAGKAAEAAQPGPLRFPRKVDCDAFLSHRRRDGGAYARLIKLNFELRGRHAFLDVDEKRPTRRFDEELLHAIERAGSFVLILTPGALDRCANEGDWLRREIRHAISLDMNIVPVMMPEFKWPKADELPEDIRPITLCEGLSYSHDYFPAFMDTLIQWAVRDGEMAAA